MFFFKGFKLKYFFLLYQPVGFLKIFYYSREPDFVGQLNIDFLILVTVNLIYI